MSALGAIAAASLLGSSLVNGLQSLGQTSTQGTSSSHLGPELGRLLAKLQKLQQQDPAKAKQLLNELAGRLQADASPPAASSTGPSLFASLLNHLSPPATH